jgi:hypothetical protein
MDCAQSRKSQAGSADGNVPDARCRCAEGEAVAVQEMWNGLQATVKHVVEESKAGSPCVWAMDGVKNVHVRTAHESQGSSAVSAEEPYDSGVCRYAVAKHVRARNIQSALAWVEWSELLHGCRSNGSMGEGLQAACSMTDGARLQRGMAARMRSEEECG